MKKMAAMILSLIVMLTSVGSVMLVQAEESETGLYSQEMYAGYQLEWGNNGIRDVLLSVTDERGTISYEYDVNWNRTKKTDQLGEITTFQYDSDGRLQNEWKNGHILSYEYNEKSELISITIDNVKYGCVLEDGSVTKLLNEAGNVVVAYVYDGNRVCDTYEVIDGGVWIRRTDEEFIGNLNRITYKSFYYDIETGWYYCGRYFDVDADRYVDGTVGLLETYLEMMSSGGMARSARASTVASIGASLYTTCINDSTFGRSVPYYSNWYSDETMSILEVMARLVYGENPYAGAPNVDRQAVGWVVWNRKVAAGYGGNTLRAVVENNEAFTTITGGSDSSQQARNPSVTASSWSSAVWVACYVYAAEYLNMYSGVSLANAESSLIDAMPRPIGITNQTSFRNHQTFQSIDINSISNIALAGYGSGYTSLSAVNAAYNAYKARDGFTGEINVYFNE